MDPNKALLGLPAGFLGVSPRLRKVEIKRLGGSLIDLILFTLIELTQKISIESI